MKYSEGKFLKLDSSFLNGFAVADVDVKHRVENLFLSILFNLLLLLLQHLLIK